MNFDCELSFGIWIVFSWTTKVSHKIQFQTIVAWNPELYLHLKNRLRHFLWIAYLFIAESFAIGKQTNQLVSKFQINFNPPENSQARFTLDNGKKVYVLLEVFQSVFSLLLSGKSSNLNECFLYFEGESSLICVHWIHNYESDRLELEQVEIQVWNWNTKGRNSSLKLNYQSQKMSFTIHSGWSQIHWSVQNWPRSRLLRNWLFVVNNCLTKKKEPVLLNL